MQPKDIDGARAQGMKLGESKVVGSCTFTLAQGWLHEKQGWHGALFLEVENLTDAATACVAVAALVDVLPEPCSVVSKSFTLAPGASKKWRAALESPARTGVNASIGWAYLGLRGEGLDQESGYRLHGLPENFQER